MKTAKSKPEMLDEYDFSKGVLGKYTARYAEGTNIILLDEDVAKVFKDSATVNAKLRSLIPVKKKKGVPEQTLVVREKKPKYGK